MSRWPHVIVAAMGLAVALYALDLRAHLLTPDASALLQQVAGCGMFFGAGVLCVLRARAAREDRVAWWSVAVAMTGWGVATVFYLVLMDPWVGYRFWLASYLPAYVAVLAVLRKRSGAAGGDVRADALAGLLGVGIAAAALTAQSMLANAHGAGVVSIYLAIPVLALGLPALVVATTTSVGWNASGIWHLIGPACAGFAIGDSIYLSEIASSTYAPAGIGDITWPLAALLVGVAAWRGPARAPAAAAPAVGDEHGDTEATTDAVTGLANRRQLAVDLTAHLEHLDASHSLVLTLFDLDGFKHYNDTFGHPAGDLMLRRLGASLSDCMAGCGTAYRMAGDEFCTLWVCPDDDDASIITMEAAAAASLSEHGDAFSIGSSYGSVRLPAEARDVGEALRAADQRMFVRKSGARPAAERQSSDVLRQVLAESSDLTTRRSSVADLVYASALRLGMAPEDAEAARQTALLHDVGKVAIPSAILNKPGALNDAEWAFMRRHTIIGERIISAAPQLDTVAKLVRSTYERFDGDGYPDGLAGPDIPLIARIVCVCVAYHAMVTERAYRGAHDHEWAVAELRRCAGTQFDSRVVEAVVRSLESSDHPDDSATGAGRRTSSSPGS
jgi:two-component system cell cycle response regulator